MTEELRPESQPGDPRSQPRGWSGRFRKNGMTVSYMGTEEEDPRGWKGWSWTTPGRGKQMCAREAGIASVPCRRTWSRRGEKVRGSLGLARREVRTPDAGGPGHATAPGLTRKSSPGSPIRASTRPERAWAPSSAGAGQGTQYSLTVTCLVLEESDTQDLQCPTHIQ